MTAHENSRSRPGGAESPFFPCCLVKKWHVADPKMIFFLKLGGLLFSAKVQNHPGPTKSAGTCTKFKKYLQRLCNKMRADMCIPGCLLFMWGVFPRFRFRISGAASQKNPISALWKWKKHFLWDETKISLCGIPLHSKGHARVWYGLVPTNYVMLMAESSSFNLKVMQPRTWWVISVKGLSGKQFFSTFEFFSRF
jgi:hypothetical protein